MSNRNIGMVHTVKELSRIIKGSVFFSTLDTCTIEHIVIDSRKIAFPNESIFFAIKGERYDGHLFIPEVMEKGVQIFVVSRTDTFPKIRNNYTIIQVENTTEALQLLARWHRLKFKYPVIGITGSNAKTIIKEWLSQLLTPEYYVVKSPKSYNSQVGVPLSVWQMHENHTLAIFEAGISKPGEMEKLERILKPTLGIFTNIGPAHDEGFLNTSQKIQEKLKLFANVKKVIYCNDFTDIEYEVEKKNIPSVTWSFFGKSDYKVLYQNIGSETATISLSDTKTRGSKNKTIEYQLPFNDSASVENAIHCIVLMTELKIKPESIQRKIWHLRPISMRLEMKEAIQNCYVIDDSYNNDLAGLTIALDFLNNQKIKSKKTLILSDLLETGVEDNSLYQKISLLIQHKKIHTVIGIGKSICEQKKYFGSALLYDSVETFLYEHDFSNFNNELILVKGARKFGFERIVERLQYKSHKTVFEINLDALAHNLNYYRSLLSGGTKIMVMVKSFAYGTGIVEVANLLQFHRVDYLAVAYADEGLKLRQSGIHLPIMVMNAHESELDIMHRHKLEPVVYSIQFLQTANTFANKTGKSLIVHIEVDSGMNRLGIRESDIPEVLKILAENRYIKVASVFSHLASADLPEFDDFTHAQAALFEKICNQLAEKLPAFVRHLANSAAISRFKPYHFDMVRLGIGLYGIDNEISIQKKLLPIGVLKTRLTQIREVQKGETIGYNRKGMATENTRIGIISIGYGDGYPRCLSNGIGQVYIRGKRVPTIGNICMDMTMIDLKDVEASEDDEVEIFGNHITIQEVAAWAQTIPYEILTGISERVKRVFYTE